MRQSWFLLLLLFLPAKVDRLVFLAHDTLNGRLSGTTSTVDEIRADQDRSITFSVH